MAKQYGIKDFEKFFNIRYNRKCQQLCLFVDKFGNCQQPVQKTGWLWSQCNDATTLQDFCRLVRQKSPEEHIFCQRHQKTRRHDHDAYHKSGLSPLDELRMRLNLQYSYGFIADDGHQSWHRHLLRQMDWMPNKQKMNLMKLALNHMNVARQNRSPPAPLFDRIMVECRQLDCNF